MSEHLDEQTLNLFLDDMLDAAEREQAEIHLTICADCRAALAHWHELFTALDTLAPVAAASPESAQAFVDAVLARVGRKRRLWPWLTAQTGLALGLLLWLWPQMSGWARAGQSWLADGLQDLGGFLTALAGGLVGWAGWLGEGLISVVDALSLTLPVSASFLQWAVLLVASLLVWLLGHWLLLQDNAHKAKVGRVFNPPSS